MARGGARQAILDAAGRLYAEQGFLATSVEQIAAAAGVARPTVFTAVGGKAAILKEVVDIALSGDEEPVPVRERPWFVEMMDEPDPHRMLALHARNITTMSRRVAAVYGAVEAASTADPEVGALWESLQAQRLAGSRMVADRLAGKAALREGYDADSVTDVLWSVGSPMVYRKTVDERGWTPERYELWMADLLRRLFLPDAA